MNERRCSVEGCTRTYECRGLCNLHYLRLRNGTSFDKPVKPLNGEALAWLRSAVLAETDKCQLWPYRNPRGYGRVYWDRKPRFAHHVALILVGREAPIPPMETRHLCGNGHLGCVNPQHLLNGTSKQNGADMVAAGRSTRGEKNRHCKLRAADVLAIRNALGTYRAIAERYGVSAATVDDIRGRRSWTWL